MADTPKALARTDEVGGSVPVPNPTQLTTEAIDRLHEQVQQEIAASREILETRLGAMDRASDLVREDFNTKLPSMIDLRISSLSQSISGQFSALSKISDERQNNMTLKFEGFKELVTAHFTDIEHRFNDLFARIEQTAKDRQQAVDAQFASAKEAVIEQNRTNGLSIEKSEKATTKQLDLINDKISSMSQNMDSKINDLKDRIIAAEARAGVIAATAETRALSVASAAEARANAIDTKYALIKSTNEGTTTGQSNVWGTIGGVVGLIAAVIAVVVSIVAVVLKR